MFGPQPPEELLEDLPDTVTKSAAISAWRTGYVEGREGEEHRIFPDHPDLQPLYSDGHGEGRKDLAAVEALARQSHPETAAPDHGPGDKANVVNGWDVVGVVPTPALKALKLGASFEIGFRGLFYATATVYLIVRMARGE